MVRRSYVLGLAEGRSGCDVRKPDGAQGFRAAGDGVRNRDVFRMPRFFVACSFALSVVAMFFAFAAYLTVSKPPSGNEAFNPVVERNVSTLKNQVSAAIEEKETEKEIAKSLAWDTVSVKKSDPDVARKLELGAMVRQVADLDGRIGTDSRRARDEIIRNLSMTPDGAMAFSDWAIERSRSSEDKVFGAVLVHDKEEAAKRIACLLPLYPEYRWQGIVDNCVERFSASFPDTAARIGEVGKVMMALSSVPGYDTWRPMGDGFLDPSPVSAKGLYEAGLLFVKAASAGR